METVEDQEHATPVSMPPGPKLSHTRRPRRIYSLIGAIAALAMVALLTRALIANPGGSLLGSYAPNQGTPGLWGVPGSDQSTQLSATPTGQPGVSYDAITMVSPSDGWLFGATFPTTFTNGPASGPCGGCDPFILHYDGTQWRRVPAPNTGPITAVSMVSSSDGWAVSHGTILHYTGGAWTVAYTYAVPNDDINLNSIAMASPSEGWAGGMDGGPTSVSPLLLHYFGGKWQRVTLPNAGGATRINTIEMVSPTEGWALETIFNNAGGEAGTQLLHYTHGVWHSVGGLVAATLTGLAAVSSQTVWMVGSVTGTTGGIFEYNDGQIAQVSSPTPNIIHAVTMLSPTDGWAVGDGAATLHWDGTRWTKVGFIIHGVALMSVSFPTSSEGWAEGTAVTSGPDQQATLLHYIGGAWHVYSLKIGG